MKPTRKHNEFTTPAYRNRPDLYNVLVRGAESGRWILAKAAMNHEEACKMKDSIRSKGRDVRMEMLPRV